MCQFEKVYKSISMLVVTKLKTGVLPVVTSCMRNCEYRRWQTMPNFDVKYLENKKRYRETFKEVII